MYLNVDVTVGALYGDEGKGSFVNYLCSIKENPLVIRFNGGHQVGHTVVLGDKRHVFSNFGSGTLQNVPTYWSEYCTVSPVGVMKEGDVLREMGIEPIVYYNANAMVTTPFDVYKNHVNERDNGHGSVGVGFGTTIQRNEDNYHLYVRDLQYPKIRDQKLKKIIDYYEIGFDPTKPYQNKATRKLYDNFIKACDNLVNRYNIVDGLNNQLADHNLIFEGGQGIMLDQKYGFFPNVTRSNTTSKNALEIIKKLPFKTIVKIYYITRAYQSRHGNGYMTNTELDTSFIKENPNETNVLSTWQGEFRKSVLDLDMLKYAISCDGYENPDTEKIMVVTCLDQVPEKIPVTMNSKLTEVDWKEIPSYCGISYKQGSYSDKGINNYK